MSLLFSFHRSADDQRMNRVWRRTKMMGLGFPAALQTHLGSREPDWKLTSAPHLNSLPSSQGDTCQLCTTPGRGLLLRKCSERLHTCPVPLGVVLYLILYLIPRLLPDDGCSSWSRSLLCSPLHLLSFKATFLLPPNSVSVFFIRWAERAKILAGSITKNWGSPESFHWAFLCTQLLRKVLLEWEVSSLVHSLL